jgi:hypothetical protein
VRVGGAVTLLAHAVRTAPSDTIRKSSRLMLSTAREPSSPSARARQTTP